MTDLVEFLRARLADDAAAVADPNVPGSASACLSGQQPRQYWSKDRARREVEAKRSVLERHGATNADECPSCGAWLDGTWRTGPGELCPELASLATVYADHPDYQAQWRP